MSIKTTRYKNLLRLIKEAGGNKSEVSRRAATSVAYISDIANKATTPAGTERGVGDKLARALEAGFNKPAGWMDEDHSKTLLSADFGDLTPDEVEFVQSLLDLYRDQDVSALSKARKVMDVIGGES